MDQSSTCSGIVVDPPLHDMYVQRRSRYVLQTHAPNSEQPHNPNGCEICTVCSLTGFEVTQV